MPHTPVHAGAFEGGERGRRAPCGADAARRPHCVRRRVARHPPARGRTAAVGPRGSVRLERDNFAGAVAEATAVGCRWTFTADAESFLLLETARTGAPLARIVHRVALELFAARTTLDAFGFLTEVQARWTAALAEVAPTVAGLGMAPDHLLVSALRALLAAPVAAVRDARRRRRDPALATRLVEWILDEQGWAHDERRWGAEVDRLTAVLRAWAEA